MERPKTRSKRVSKNLLEGAASIGEGMASIDLSLGLCPQSLGRTLRDLQEQARNGETPFDADRQALQGDWEQIGRDLESILGKPR